MNQTATQPLGRWETRAVAGFFVIMVLFGLMVEQRSAFLTRRMGDLDVFLRAAWAVRNDADLYAITSDNDWHYLYPPLYAILMTPLADPPKGEVSTGYVPYALSVAIVFFLSLICLLLASHILASAIEEHVGWNAQPVGCRRWWALRLWPIVVCLLPIGHTLMRGQVNLMVLAILCASLAGWIRQQSFRAGLWLAFAICIKVIPIYLLVYPLWKRDGRALLGCTVGAIAGLVIVPLLAMGPSRTLAQYESYGIAFFGPMLNISDDERSREEIATTDSIGVKNALHNWMYRGPEKYVTPMHPISKAIYLLLGVVMTFLTLWPVRRGKIAESIATSSGNGTATTDPAPFACLILLMTIFSPVSHMHYLLFCMPIVMCLITRALQNQVTLRIPVHLTMYFIAFNATVLIAYLPNMEFLRDLCITLVTTLPFWVIPVSSMWRGTSTASVATPAPARQAA